MVLADGTPTSHKGHMDTALSFMDRHGMRYHTHIQPWLGVSRRLHRLKNVLVFEIVRTPDREDQYIWLKRLRLDDVFLMAKPDSYWVGASKAAILAGGAKVGCGAHHATCEVLQDFGFPPDRIIEAPGGNDAYLAHLLSEGRIEFMLSNRIKLDGYADLWDAQPLVPVIKVHDVDVYLGAFKASLEPDARALLESLDGSQ